MVLFFSCTSYISQANHWLFPPQTPSFPSVNMYLWLGHERKSPKQNNKCEMQEEKNMCRKLVVTNKLSLGNRELGWETYSLPKGELVEFTSKQLKDAIRLGTDEVYGLKVSEETGELVFDEAFFTTNMMNKLHINTLVPMVEDDCLANLFYIVIGTHKVKQETMYDVISSRYERASFNAEKVKNLLEMGIISGGAKLENGEIVVASLEKPRNQNQQSM